MKKRTLMSPSIRSRFGELALVDPVEGLGVEQFRLHDLLAVAVHPYFGVAAEAVDVLVVAEKEMLAHLLALAVVQRELGPHEQAVLLIEVQAQLLAAPPRHADAHRRPI